MILALPVQKGSQHHLARGGLRRGGEGEGKVFDKSKSEGRIGVFRDRYHEKGGLPSGISKKRGKVRHEYKEGLKSLSPESSLELPYTNNAKNRRKNQSGVKGNSWHLSKEDLELRGKEDGVQKSWSREKVHCEKKGLKEESHVSFCTRLWEESLKTWFPTLWELGI